MELPFNTTISGDLLKGTGRFAGAGRGLVDQAPLGAARRSRRSRRPATTSAAPTPRSRIRRGRASSTPIACGRAPTWSASASPRSATSTASTCRTSTRGRPTAPPFAAATIPLSRAYRPTDEERMIRELVLQLKRGSIAPGVLPRQVRRGRPRPLPRAARLAARPTGISQAATDERRGADARRAAARRRRCCTRFFLPQHAGIRYT